MKTILLLLFCAVAGFAAEPPGKTFLRYAFGEQGMDVLRVCSPTNDLWMIPGKADAVALSELKTISGDALAKDGIAQGVLGQSLYFFEVKNGKVDPTFYLEGIYAVHRRLTLEFLYAALRQDQRVLGRLTTDAGKVSFAGTKARAGDMSQYAEILERFPSVRVSKAQDDAVSRSVTYRLPVGASGLELKMVKTENFWKIDTSNGLVVPTEIFFEQGRQRKVQYAP